jgi:hypothetical protein
VLVGWYLLRSHIWLALAGAGAALAVKRFPHAAFLITALVAAPLVTYQLFAHFYMSLFTLCIALLAYRCGAGIRRCRVGI